MRRKKPVAASAHASSSSSSSVGAGSIFVGASALSGRVARWAISSPK